MTRTRLLSALLVAMAIAAGIWKSREGRSPQPAVQVPVEANAGISPAEADMARARRRVIEDRAAALIGTPPVAPLVSDQGHAVYEALDRGDFATAVRLAREVLGRSTLQGWSFSPFNSLMTTVDQPPTPAFGEKLDVWVVKAPQEPLARVIRARYLSNVAWRIRGGGFGRHTRDDHMRQFREMSERAVSDVDAALALDSGNPWVHFLKLDILAGLGNSEALEQAFQTAIAQYPNYYALYPARMRALAPKWGGSITALVEFVDRHAGQAPTDSPLKFLYLVLYRQLLDTADVACLSARDASSRAACVEQRAARLIPDSLLDHVGEALALRSHADKHQFSEALLGELSRLVNYSYARKFTDPVVQMAADALESQTQLMEDRPGSNDFRIDLITGDIWMREGHHPNAETKYLEALRDFEHAQFPGEEERRVARAGIHSRLARLYRAMSQFEEALAHHRASEVLGGRPFAMDSLPCQCLVKLKDFAGAQRECGVLYERTADFEALYWRARMEEQLNDIDAALTDFTAVAESESGMSTSAVIHLSVILAKRKEFRAGLAMFERYAHVFDEDRESRENLAVVFNNRCYLRKELGQLEAALDDCERSLHFGNIPDARQKKADLEKALAARQKRA